MVTYKRFGVFMVVAINVSVAALLYYRVGMDHLFPMARNEHSGPWTEVIGMLEGMVPVVLAIILLGTAVWVIAGGVQEERNVMRRGRRR